MTRDEIRFWEELVIDYEHLASDFDGKIDAYRRKRIKQARQKIADAKAEVSQ